MLLLVLCVLFHAIVLLLLWHKVLNLALAHQSLRVLLLKIDPLVKQLVVEANDAPPENVIGHFVQLLGELVEYGGAALAEECAAVVVQELHLLLTL